MVGTSRSKKAPNPPFYNLVPVEMEKFNNIREFKHFFQFCAIICLSSPSSYRLTVDRKKGSVLINLSQILKVVFALSWGFLLLFPPPLHGFYETMWIIFYQYIFLLICDASVQTFLRCLTVLYTIRFILSVYVVYIALI